MALGLHAAQFIRCDPEAHFFSFFFAFFFWADSAKLTNAIAELFKEPHRAQAGGQRERPGRQSFGWPFSADRAQILPS